jgi:hypothetical protein
MTTSEVTDSGQTDTFVIAQLNTNDYIWQGAGRSEDEAKTALLAAWAAHRTRVVSQHPALASTLPEAAQMTQHFPVYYSHYVLGGGYRDRDRLV